MLHTRPTPPRQDTDSSAAIRPEAVTVAVTGAHGVLGKRLIAHLLSHERIREVVCLDVATPAFESVKFAFLDTDLTTLGVEHSLAIALADHRVDCVIHLAFRDGPSPNPGHSHELESIGTLRLVQACLKAKVRKLLLGSRTWVYGASPNAPALLDEHQPTRARRSERFFADKMDAERDVLSFRAPGRARVSTVLRMAPLVDPTVTNHVLKWLRDVRVPSVLGFDPMWQLLHVDDACRQVVSAVFRDAPPVLNVASGGAVPLSVVRRLLGTRPLYLPRSFASLMVSGCWLSGIGSIPPSMLDYLQFPCVADVTQARLHLKVTPEHSALSILQQTALACVGSTAHRSSS
ncbi:MAG TPA: NAD-dependent epimerase/dehydratase family protein [Polyangiaceae bacterium]